MPQNTESLRAKYEVLTNLWLLAQSRQPGRKLYTDLTESTWPKFLKELLNKDNLFQLRKEALRRCFEEGYLIQAALWSAYADPQHRMKHWVQLLAIANCRCSSSNADSSELAQLRKKAADLERQVSSKNARYQRPVPQQHQHTCNSRPTQRERLEEQGRPQRQRHRQRRQREEVRSCTSRVVGSASSGRCTLQVRRTPVSRNRNSTSATRPQVSALISSPTSARTRNANAPTRAQVATRPTHHTWTACVSKASLPEQLHLTWCHRPRFPTLCSFRHSGTTRQIYWKAGNDSKRLTGHLAKSAQVLTASPCSTFWTTSGQVFSRSIQMGISPCETD